ncbi:alpha/beta fold hydrolase [Paraliomyxa miuraensis]|uniref:alpha/beta fold hydrolase n=1 Tax=Paraliomyxa miuraensis TaxID=376150 RepID=UPI002252CD99|nr:alpha/beta hydrolase [Paraliomyxa miuraensis]MCX4246877.1 alpha/beta hydrolase [Paraliomyxa miuraensis]
MSPSTRRGALERDGFSLSYSIEGAGVPTLVIGSSVYYPRTFSAGLRGHLQLVFLDHRGFGRCTRPLTPSDVELSVLVEDVEALREHLGLPRVLVVGHSGHGYMAMAYAKAYPERTLGVVALAMSPDGSPASQAAADRYLEESVDPTRKQLLAASMEGLGAAIERDPDRRFIAYCLASGPRIWFDPRFDAAALWEGVEVIPEVFDHVWGATFATIDIRRDAERITMPVFLGLGRYDFWNPPHLWEPLRPFLPTLHVRVFERSGHTPQLEEPERFDDELLSWARRHGISSGG